MRTLRYFVIPLLSAIFTSMWWAYGTGMLSNNSVFATLVLASIFYGVGVVMMIISDIMND